MFITTDIQINVKLFGDKQCRCKEVDCRLYQEIHNLFLVLAIISLGKRQMVALHNPFIPNRMYFPTLINWTSPFPILGLLGCIFFIQLLKEFLEANTGEPEFVDVP